MHNKLHVIVLDHYFNGLKAASPTFELDFYGIPTHTLNNARFLPPWLQMIEEDLGDAATLSLPSFSFSTLSSSQLLAESYKNFIQQVKSSSPQ